jgi:hypothetical protein
MNGDLEPVNPKKALPEDVASFLAAYSPEVRALAQQTRDLVLETIPAALEMVDPASKIIAYGYGPKYADLVCAIAPFKSYVNLMFSQGASLPDPAGLLQGTGKRARHAKIQSPEEIDNPDLRSLLALAADRIQK